MGCHFPRLTLRSPSSLLLGARHSLPSNGKLCQVCALLTLFSVKQQSKNELLPDLPTLGERLIWAMKRKGVKNPAVAVIAGVFHTTVSKWRSNAQEPEEAQLARVAEFLDVPRGWLRYGRVAASGGRVREVSREEVPQADRVIHYRHLETPEARELFFEFLFHFARHGAPDEQIARAAAIASGILATIELVPGTSEASGLAQAIGLTWTLVTQEEVPASVYNEWPRLREYQRLFTRAIHGVDEEIPSSVEHTEPEPEAEQRPGRRGRHAR
jgi:transcriptional regulator with XRE-family HTH domain